MANGITGIDHPVCGVRDLDAAKATFEKLGFALSHRRQFQSWGNANHAVIFPYDFIELLGIVDAAKFTTPGLKEYLADGEGIMGVTLTTNDVKTARDRLERNGFGPSDLQETAIDLLLPEGTLKQRFRWIKLDADKTPDIYFMLMQPLTPENRAPKPAYLQHANTANGIKSLTVVVPDPAKLRPVYESLFGTQDRVGRPDQADIFTGHGTFRFVTKDAFARLHPGVPMPTAHKPPFIGAITLTARDVGVAAAHLRKAGVPFLEKDGAVRIAPDHACGMVLEFVAG